MRLFPTMARLSWPGQAWLVCGAFLLVGIAVVDDYGASPDTAGQRVTAARNLAFITGAADRLDGFVTDEFDLYYGVAFELPLLLIERRFGLEDSRRIYLMRHLVTHLFFLVGGVCCALLVYRLSHNRVVALFALLLFVLQPRLYAHSFFNSKDLPFLSMFMVTLYVTHRAFRKETVGAFVLCGMCVGILTNLRIMGVMVYPAVLALRGLDLGQASRGGGRTHVLVTGAAFAAVGPCTLYALSPYLWAAPFEFVTAWQTLAYHPAKSPDMLLQGRLIDPHHPPWHYLPTWVAISTPPVTLLCGVLGGIWVALRSVRHPRAALGNTDQRFGLLLVACLTLPIVAIVLLGSHIYDGWRHLYFLHAPLCGLAGLGLQYAGGVSRRAAAGVSALVGLGVLVTGAEMIQIHPHQHVYFNRLVDRTTPEYLRTHYSLDSYRITCREGLEFLRKRYPDTTIHVRGDWHRAAERGLLTLPQADRARLVLTRRNDAVEFQILCGRMLQRVGGSPVFENIVYTRKVYNNTLLTVAAQTTVPDARLVKIRQLYEDGYRNITSGLLVQQALFDIYTYPGSRILGYARDQCRAADVRARFFLHVVPVNEQDLPARRRQYGFDNKDFFFPYRGKLVAGLCWAAVALPDYAIARIRTGQHDERGKLWEAEPVGPIP